MVVHSLLDGPSAAGAYRFTIRPGDPTQIDVEATIFAREDIAHLGLAPLTSMFLFDAKDRGEHDDFRLGVHDSDGLAMWNGSDERLWRPLHSPRLLQISAFSDSGPRGFGLIQRERSFTEYEDLTRRSTTAGRAPGSSRSATGARGTWCWWRSRRARRSTTTSSPTGGRRPTSPPGSEISLTYRLSWGWDVPDLDGLLRVERTLSGAGSRRPAALRGRLRRRRAQPDPRLGGAARGAGQPGQPARRGDLGEPRDQRPAPAASTSTPRAPTSVEMRLELRSGERRIAETWVYRWSS